MSEKTIRTYFNMLDKNGEVIGDLHTESDPITVSQATQIVTRLALAQYPMRKFGLCKMTATMSPDGDALNINRTFDSETIDDEGHIFMHCSGTWCSCPETIHKTCIKNLKRGKCNNKYMCETVGTILFPDLYNKQNQKQK